MNAMLLIAIFAGIFLLLSAVYGLRFLYDYRVRAGCFELVLLGAWPAYRLSIDEIETVRKVSWREAGVAGNAIRLGNRVEGQCVLIRKRKGWFRVIVITPANADEFIAEIEAQRAAAAHL